MVTRKEHLSEKNTPEERAAAGCDGKERFTCYSRAAKVERAQNRRHDGITFKAYRCKTCGDFHVGSEFVKRKKSVIPIETPEEKEELDWLEKRNTWL